MKINFTLTLFFFYNRFQNELPAAIQERNEKYVTKMELCELMKWKLSVSLYGLINTCIFESNETSLFKTNY